MIEQSHVAREEGKIAVRQCFRCFYEGAGDQGVCPSCGGKAFLTSTNIRRRGAVVLLCGSIIAAIIGGIAIFSGLALTGNIPDMEPTGISSSDRLIFFAIFGFFALLIALGLDFVLIGGWMLVFGKRNRYFMWMTWVLLGIVLFVAVVAGFFFE